MTLLLAILAISFLNNAAAAEELQSGQYSIKQSWSQEKDYERPYYVHVPEGSDQKTFPVLIKLHGNGGRPDTFKNVRNKSLAAKYILVSPEGYNRSWNIVAERSKANDLAFIEAIVKKLSTYNNVQKDNFSIIGNSNGAALVNQIACETKLPAIKNYISCVSPLNGCQYDGKNFKVRGENNDYTEIAKPMTGKRLMNVSGTKDGLIPYKGGPSRIPAKNGRLSFVAAEESTYLWAKHMGYKGEKLAKPTKVIGKLEIFSYLDGDVVNIKVIDGNHGSRGAVSEQMILDFLEGKEL